MSSREDYKWTDEAKNLKEGLPPNNKRQSPAPQPKDTSGMQELRNKFKQWCEETKRNGSVLVGGSIYDFFDWLESSAILSTQQGKRMFTLDEMKTSIIDFGEWYSSSYKEIDPPRGIESIVDVFSHQYKKIK